MTRACSSCEWWDSPAAGDADYGYCHGAPPTAAAEDGEGVWPITASISFCGAFRMAERLAGGADRRAEG